MGLLRSIEARIERLIEGVFGRAFRANVQPVELARKLAKEMDDHRSVSVSRVYVPNEYSLYLSAPDREQFTSYESSLVGELEEYLADHAQREGYAVLTPPRVRIETDDDLAVGEFGIATRMVQPRGRSAGDSQEPAPARSGETMVYKPQSVPTQAASPAELGIEEDVAAITFDGQRRVVDKPRVVLGRSKECDIQIPDPNVSRRHAELRREGTAYWIVDLDSTNGIEVNGRRARRAKLEDGDRLTIGSTDIVFERGAR